MAKVYIAKPDTWYDEGTIVLNLCDETYFLGEGVCTKQKFLVDGIEHQHNGIDEEGCGFDEFDEYEVPDEVAIAIEKTFNILSELNRQFKKEDDK